MANPTVKEILQAWLDGELLENLFIMKRNS